MNKNKAFTIIELLVVIVIIGVLASVVIVSFSNVSSRGIVASLQSDLTSAKRQLINFQTQSSTSSFPTAINCSSPSASEICIKPSGSNTFSYNVNNSSNPATFNLTATNGTTKYWINDNSNPLTSSGVVSSGLIFNVDASNPSSYSGIGNIWTNLNGVSTNATLFNSPSYSTDKSGYFNFSSSSSQYATAPNLGSVSNWTVEVIARFNASYSTKVSMIIGNQYNGASSLNFTIGTNNSPTNYNIAVGFFDGSWRSTTGVSYPQNTWVHITGSYDGTTIRQFTNGSQVDSLSYSGTPTSGGELRINRRWDDVVSSGNLFDANIALARVYNRALSAAEITQNFNATRDRYGL